MKLLTVALLLVAMILVGCGGEKEEEIPAILLKKSFWVADSENIPYVNDAISRKDADYLEQLILEGKVFLTDKDTKVIRLGTLANKNNARILFKEGRYTNKTGYAHVGNVILEKDYTAYLEQQRHDKFAKIRDSISGTEKYADVIATGNLEEVERLRRYCLDKTNELKKFRLNQESDILEQSEMAIRIIFARDEVLCDYKYFIEYSQKVEREGQGKKKFNVDSHMQEHYRADMEKHSQEAEQLRQEFRNKYGY